MMDHRTLKFEYHWWDLEDTEFKGEVVGEIVTRFALRLKFEGPSFKDWNEFARSLPDKAYAWQVAIRFNHIEQLFVGLRIIPQMLGVREIPIKSDVQDINRYDWLVAAKDLAFYRFSSIRDGCLHFVNELLELGIDSKSLTLKNLKKRIGKSHPKIVSFLEEIAQSGKNLREERNKRAHEGSITLGTDDDEMFKNLSWAEAYGFKALNQDKNDFDVDSIYRESSLELYERLVHETKSLLKEVESFVDSLLTEFETRYAAKGRKD